jgi:hypothetical protein
MVQTPAGGIGDSTRMKRFPITDAFEADCVVSEAARAGLIYHVARNATGGATFTPIARYFVWRPEFVEGYHKYWRVDCFVRRHKLSPEPMWLGESLVAALVREQLSSEPIWMSAHISDELKGKAYGEVFSDD